MGRSGAPSGSAPGDDSAGLDPGLLCWLAQVDPVFLALTGRYCRAQGAYLDGPPAPSQALIPEKPRTRPPRRAGRAPFSPGRAGDPDPGGGRAVPASQSLARRPRAPPARPGAHRTPPAGTCGPPAPPQSCFSAAPGRGPPPRGRRRTPGRPRPRPGTAERSAACRTRSRRGASVGAAGTAGATRARAGPGLAFINPGSGARLPPLPARAGRGAHAPLGPPSIGRRTSRLIFAALGLDTHARPGPGFGNAPEASLAFARDWPRTSRSLSFLAFHWLPSRTFSALASNWWLSRTPSTGLEWLPLSVAGALRLLIGQGMRALCAFLRRTWQWGGVPSLEAELRLRLRNPSCCILTGPRTQLARPLGPGPEAGVTQFPARVSSVRRQPWKVGSVA